MDSAKHFSTRNRGKGIEMKSIPVTFILVNVSNYFHHDWNFGEDTFDLRRLKNTSGSRSRLNLNSLPLKRLRKSFRTLIPEAPGSDGSWYTPYKGFQIGKFVSWSFCSLPRISYFPPKWVPATVILISKLGEDALSHWRFSRKLTCTPWFLVVRQWYAGAAWSRNCLHLFTTRQRMLSTVMWTIPLRFPSYMLGTADSRLQRFLMSTGPISVR